MNIDQEAQLVAEQELMSETVGILMHGHRDHTWHSAAIQRQRPHRPVHCRGSQAKLGRVYGAGMMMMECRHSPTGGPRTRVDRRLSHRKAEDQILD